ncbi:peptidase U32 family protein [Ancylomarina longa]|uniref:U32 family peptidase n=1 Tax=Ancylomarina longa TaxID=2487017 RepID=A0A434AZM3_9BACT|nr:U32 family peptidase [Ancylomarina longa]RUT80053.1 U32 family peptidase [Ancylomarina longa]
MNKKIELLAPGGDIDSIKAAIAAGANAIYCGLNKFNARNRAANITFEDLNGILRLAHKNDCEVFLTLNIIFVESEIPDLIRLLNKLINTSIDGVIIQDLGLFYILSNYFKSLKIHASTQLTTHNKGQLKFLSKLTANRVNLSRELNIKEINHLSHIAHQNNLLTEVFVHGSYCISFSGICYMSSVHGGNSGNRGRCSQPCREQYISTPRGIDYPLNLKDNSAYLDLPELADAGVDSLKIEGRIKKYPYVYTVVDAYRKQLNKFYQKEKLNRDTSILYKVFNRDFSDAFLQGNLHKDMFIDNPRNHSAIHLAKQKGSLSEENLEAAKKEVYEQSMDISAQVKKIIDQYHAAKAPVEINVSGQDGLPLKVSVTTPETTFDLVSDSNLVNTDKQSLDYDGLLKRLKAINDTEYFIKNMKIGDLQTNLYLPFKELTAIKNKIVFRLNDSREILPPVKIPGLKKQDRKQTKASLSVLISSEEDLKLCGETIADIYFQIPNSIKDQSKELMALFTSNKNIIPWFPTILIGDDYDAAVNLLREIQPNLIVSNNTGIAYEANQLGIDWIAGPQLNIVNSYSLLCLKENFNCSGSFISNEINQQQIRSIKKPKDFKLYYSIYHPMELMTSRQCLFHQVIGCEKDSIDENCIPNCDKSVSLSNLKNTSFFINKTKGNYHKIYNEHHFLNTAIVTDIPDFFSSFFIDLRDVKTETKMEVDKLELIKLFENHLEADSHSTQQIKKRIHPITNNQYQKGI